jgi:hypothetical protein
MWQICEIHQLLTLIVFLQKMQGFFHSLEWSYFPQCWHHAHFKALRGRQYSYQKLTQFSQENNVLIIILLVWMVFLPKILCFFHSLERSSFAQRWYSSHLKTLRCRQYAHQMYFNSHRETMCKTLLPLTWCVSYKKNSASSSHLKGAVLHKGDVPHTGQTEVGSVPFRRLLTSHREAMCNILLPLTQLVLFHKIHVFLHFIWRGYFP